MILFLILGIITIYLGLSVDLKCAEVSITNNLAAGFPLIIFGIYNLLTTLFLWRKPDIGRGFVAVAVLIALILIVASVFDLSIPIIKISCTTL